jgi:hypothetical protein
MLVAFFGSSKARMPASEVNPQPELALSNVNATAHYLTAPPFYPNNSYKTTKIYLESAYLWSGISTTISAADIFTNPKGTSLFTVNGTVRNDYSTEEILKLSKEGINTCYVGLDIYLYDAQGNYVNTLSRGNTFRGYYEMNLKGGEEANFEVAFAAASPDIASFEVYVNYLDPVPLF